MLARQGEGVKRRAWSFCGCQIGCVVVSSREVSEGEGIRIRERGNSTVVFVAGDGLVEGAFAAAGDGRGVLGAPVFWPQISADGTQITCSG